MQFFAHALTAQPNRDIVAPANPIRKMETSIITVFFRMNPSKLSASKVEEHPYGLIGEVYKVLSIMGVSSVEKAELDSYQLKDVSQIWYEQ